MMKIGYIKNIKKIFLTVLAVGAITSCNDDDFFVLTDRNGLDAAIWNTPGAVEMHLRRAYDMIMPEFGYEQLISNQLHGRAGIHYASDESLLPVEDIYAQAALGIGGEPLGNNSVWYVGDKYSFTNKGENKYNDISRCNYAIKYIPLGTMSDADKNAYLGQYYALRAMAYFGMVKVYGGVPLVLEPQDPANIAVTGRASAKDCFTAIVRDLDSAMSKLNGKVWSPSTDRGRLDKVAAAALKAKVLLYWASPQFNPLNDGKHVYDANRWTEALKANKEAYDLCLAAGRSLVSNYAEIFRLEGAANPEVIISRTYSNSIAKRGHDIEKRSRPSSESGNANDRYRASIILLEAYPMKDGNPITDLTKKYKYDDELFWLNRDPRFEATIAYNGSTWPLSGKTTRKQWAYVGAKNEGSADKGVFCKRFTSPTLAAASVGYNSDVGGGNGMDWIEMRFAEVMLNYAECANETGDLALAKNLVRQIRIRAGIEEGSTPLNLNNDYGLKAVTSLTAMRELIYNERFVEFAFENKRNSDLRRMRRMHTLASSNIYKTLLTIQINPKAGMIDSLEKVVNTTTGQMLRETLNLNDKATYEKYFEAPSLITYFTKSFNVPEYHYFYTFHDSFVNTGTDILPTVGWSGGLFDPLD